MKTYLVEVKLPDMRVATKTLQANSFAWLANTVRFYDATIPHQCVVAEFNASNVLCVWGEDTEVKDA